VSCVSSTAMVSPYFVDTTVDIATVTIATKACTSHALI